MIKVKQVVSSFVVTCSKGIEYKYVLRVFFSLARYRSTQEVLELGNTRLLTIVHSISRSPKLTRFYNSVHAFYLFNINLLLALYHECRSLIGCATHAKGNLEFIIYNYL